MAPSAPAEITVSPAMRTSASHCERPMGEGLAGVLRLRAEVRANPMSRPAAMCRIRNVHVSSGVTFSVKRWNVV